MLADIKKMQGINHNEFDTRIENYIKSCKIDLELVGINSKKLEDKNIDELLKTAIITYVLSFLDVTNSEMYTTSYILQKDVLRHMSRYITEI